MLKKYTIIPLILSLLVVYIIQSCSSSHKPLSDILEPFSGILENPDALYLWDTEKCIVSCQELFQRIPDIEVKEKDELVTLLIAMLSAPERPVYHPAAYILRFVTKKNHGFNSFGTETERASAIKQWEEWWEKNRDNFTFPKVSIEQSTLVIDEIPGRIHGDDENPPGYVVDFNKDGRIIWETSELKMPYDAVRTADGGYLINIIRERAVWDVSITGKVVKKRKVGGYPCSLQLLENNNILVAGWDDNVPGFVREFDPDGKKVWSLELLQWPWKAERLNNGNTLIADAGTKRVFETTQDKKEIWAVENLGPEKTELFDSLGPVYCQRIENGNTLVSIRGISKVVELNKHGDVVWEVGKDIVKNQYSAIRLWNGNTLIADGGNFRVIELDINKNLVWEKSGFGYPAKAYRH
ncbi:hypothetical protein ACFL67_02540 [candidate division KSB1 bacterium]